MLSFDFEGMYQRNTLQVDRDWIISSLKKYTSAFREEVPFVAEFLELLKHPDAFHRHHLPGHITGSSWILDHSHQYVLLVHHGTLNKWLQPGGHADGEENVLNVALREAEEETGVKQFKLLLENIFDLDIHPIPARGGFPEHLHYDIRFLFEADKNEKVIVSEESHDVSWIPVYQLSKLTNDNPSIMRMLEKVRG
jgi:8-oxo-dGTP pyrophosphatase MutT (NUDIX family)